MNTDRVDRDIYTDIVQIDIYTDRVYIDINTDIVYIDINTDRVYIYIENESQTKKIDRCINKQYSILCTVYSSILCTVYSTVYCVQYTAHKQKIAGSWSTVCSCNNGVLLVYILLNTKY